MHEMDAFVARGAAQWTWPTIAHWVALCIAICIALAPALSCLRDKRWRAIPARLGFVAPSRTVATEGRGGACLRAAQTNAIAVATLIAKPMLGYLVARGMIACMRFGYEFSRNVVQNPLVLTSLIAPKLPTNRVPARLARMMKRAPVSGIVPDALSISSVLDAAGSACARDFLDARARATIAAHAAVTGVLPLAALVIGIASLKCT